MARTVPWLRLISPIAILSAKLELKSRQDRQFHSSTFWPKVAFLLVSAMKLSKYNDITQHYMLVKYISLYPGHSTPEYIYTLVLNRTFYNKVILYYWVLACSNRDWKVTSFIYSYLEKMNVILLVCFLCWSLVINIDCQHKVVFNVLFRWILCLIYLCVLSG